MSSLLIIFNVLGSVALFLFGMKVLSESLQRNSGSKLQEILHRTTSNPLSGVISGTLLTAVFQSSSLVSILTLSFVQAGLLNLKRAFSIMVGANLGTTLKLWLIVGLGLFWKVESLALPLIALAVIFLFFQNQKARDASSFLMGIGLIFIGFYFLNQILPDFSQVPIFKNLMEEFAENPSYLSGFIFVIIGMNVTIFFHSSSAFILLVAVWVGNGIGIDKAAYLVIGSNIGTTSAALMASLVGNSSTKKLALFHFFFNLAGGILFFFFIPNLMQFLSENVSNNQEILLVLFHTLFNFISALLILPFINSLAEWADSKNSEKAISAYDLQMISNPMGPTAKMYLYEANREMQKFAGITTQIINYLGRMISESDEVKLEELFERILQLENEADELERQILDYLDSLYQFEMSGDVALNIHRLIDICHHLENIGDLSARIGAIHLERRKNNSFITPKLRELLLELQDSLSSATSNLVQNLNETSGEINLKRAKKLERSIDKKFDKAEGALLKAIDADKLTARSALYYTEMIQNYELIGDHLYQVNKALGK